MATNLHRNEKSRNSAYKICFDELPDIGCKIQYYGNTITLIAYHDYIKKDGSNGRLLIWRRNDGVIAASGLRSHSLSYPDLVKDYA